MTARYGDELAEDLSALGILYKRFEWESGYPWLVSKAAVDEAQLLTGPLGDRLRALIDFLRGHQSDWGPDSFGSIAPGLLFPEAHTRVSPLILKALGVAAPADVSSPTGPLRFLPDPGDRRLAASALFANVPVLLTTDRRTFWTHRGALSQLGLAVLRPSELLGLYEPYWEAWEGERARRRSRP